MNHEIAPEGPFNRRAPPCLQLLLLRLASAEKWLQSVFGLKLKSWLIVRRQPALLSENGGKLWKKKILPQKSLFFGRILMLPKIALFVQNFWSKLIVFWRIATILQYFRGNQLWLMISHQLHCFCSIKSGKRHDSTKRDVCRQRFANRDEGRLQIAMHAVHLFLELWIMTFLDGKPEVP